MESLPICRSSSISFLSPFAIFGALVRSPLILPWLSLALALVGGFGAYIFSRRVLQVGVWPATIAAWCYPITGFFVFWQSYSLPHPIVWLPWLLYGVHAVLSGSGRWALPGLALTTFLTVISGHLDMAGLVLIMGGLFAAWKFLNAYRDPENRRIAIQRLIAVAAGWMLGFMLASPELLPALEYAKTGSRLNRRGAGLEERPPIGLASLPQLVLPDLYGATNNKTVPFVPNGESNVAESPAAGFSGLIASLVIAPLAWGSRRHRSLVVFFGAAAILGAAWCLNLPGIVQLMRMPPLNNLSYNRFVFASSFAILALAAIGLEESAKGTFRWNNWVQHPHGNFGRSFRVVPFPQLRPSGSNRRNLTESDRLRLREAMGPRHGRSGTGPAVVFSHVSIERPSLSPRARSLGIPKAEKETA